MRGKSRRITITFEDDELDAVIAGLVMLQRDEGGDEDSDLATAVLQRIAAALDDGPSGPPPKPEKGDGAHHGVIREAIHGETKLTLRYVDKKGAASRRTIWPLELGFVGAGETVAAWCESRRDFRHFRLDRIAALERTGERYPARRRILLARLHIDEMEQVF